MKTIIRDILGVLAAIGSFVILAVLILSDEIGKFCDDIIDDDIW